MRLGSADMGEYTQHDLLFKTSEEPHLPNHPDRRMPEPVSLMATDAYLALSRFARNGTAVSSEAATIQRSASAVAEAGERSIALFGRKAAAISDVWTLVTEHSRPNWNGEDAVPL